MNWSNAPARRIEKSSRAIITSSKLIRIPWRAWRCMSIRNTTRANSPSLYVNPSHENQGIGRKLIQFVESKAREMGLNELLTLSTQAFTYFQSKGGFAGRHAG